MPNLLSAVKSSSKRAGEGTGGAQPFEVVDVVVGGAQGRLRVGGHRGGGEGRGHDDVVLRLRGHL